MASSVMPFVPVAPLVGAWIEIVQFTDDRLGVEVAPLVGAWIEIYDKLSDGIIELVAPLVGAWIEIRRTLYCL